MSDRHVRMRTVVACSAGATLALVLAGCLDAPKIEDRWTRVDMAGASLAPSQPVAAGSTIPVQVSSDIYYRRILTGYAVAELRASTSISPGMLQMNPNANRLQMANDMDRLLATSVSMGREARAFTGWDHLIQHMDFAFTGVVPGTVTDSVGTGPTAGLFLVCYLGSGVKVERQDGTDTVIVTPYTSSPYQILPVGLSVTVAP
ncbi:MAG TPA: hypothetical protein VNM39_12300 [Verrucomicrobiae bacterium]|nr:hypothetical protein [Verrucomicrobiae bacterium]